MGKKIVLSFLALTLFSGMLHAATHEAAPKSYTLKDLRLIVSNGNECKPFYHNLKKFEKNPINLHFETPVKGKHAVKHASADITNHTHSTVKQTVKNDKVHRIGMGTFDYKQEAVHYVVEVSADLKNEEHKHIHPLLMSI
ncbi:MAG: hypothetical protein COX62_07410 [Deltaproteobacteria bacterium CG_4_10_14_0_2_um_filter_43_8]|nr:MAG: hypothetical protein COV43_06155 [Deltaproteobacteria bacterium CG11_big_fil_rev_8_21_14_0_20_42_23]PJA19039.1 MAG: hypothetical protein COX62_07410 [Deltaproteobacteria bacterium CG_4_10_14_0_2_um_filter_43_8]PJC65175.1 MAG: hypothetical protein CO021_00550 [Deltaproteobacteria bacterium CG_4_9_14_0_2_um_filter_42_21]